MSLRGGMLPEREGTFEDLPAESSLQSGPRYREQKILS